jgi:hypothetical protein
MPVWLATMPHRVRKYGSGTRGFNQRACSDRILALLQQCCMQACVADIDKEESVVVGAALLRPQGFLDVDAPLSECLYMQYTFWRVQTSSPNMFVFSVAHSCPCSSPCLLQEFERRRPKAFFSLLESGQHPRLASSLAGSSATRWQGEDIALNVRVPSPFAHLLPGGIWDKLVLPIDGFGWSLGLRSWSSLKHFSSCSCCSAPTPGHAQPGVDSELS